MKRLISVILIIIMVCAVPAQISFAQEQPELRGISITYRQTDIENVIALDFRAYGVAGDTFAIGLQFDNAIVDIVTPSGGKSIGAAAYVVGLPNGDADVTNTVRDKLNTDEQFGWGTIDIVSIEDKNKIKADIALTTQKSRYDMFDIKPDTVSTAPVVSDLITPTKDGLGLFSICFTPVEGKSLEDINTDTFALFNAGSQALKGVAIINHGHIIADGIVWVDVPGKTAADNDPAGGTHPPVDFIPQNSPTPTPSVQPSSNPSVSSGPGGVNNPTPTPSASPIITPSSSPAPIITTQPALEKVDHYRYVMGYVDDTIRPDNNITREEVAAIFYRLLTKETRSQYRKSETEFPDIEADRWSARSIGTMQNAGIVKGYNTGLFMPQENITRAEFATIAMRFDTVSDTATHSFTDISGHWAEKNIASAAAKGWITGDPGGTFRPDQPITRVEAMVLINRVLGRKVDDQGLMKDIVVKWGDINENHWGYYDVLEATISHVYARRDAGAKLENWTGKGEDIDFSKE